MFLRYEPRNHLGSVTQGHCVYICIGDLFFWSIITPYYPILTHKHPINIHTIYQKNIKITCLYIIVWKQPCNIRYTGCFSIYVSYHDYCIILYIPLWVQKHICIINIVSLSRFWDSNQTTKHIWSSTRIIDPWKSSCTGVMFGLWMKYFYATGLGTGPKYPMTCHKSQAGGVMCRSSWHPNGPRDHKISILSKTNSTGKTY